MRDEAERRIGHLYPDATGPDGEKLTPIAWIWARTVESPDPSWLGHVPLVASWTLSKRPGKPKVWIEPIIDRADMTISYAIRQGGEPSHDRTVESGNGRCVATGAAISGDYIKSESRAGRMGQQLIAVVAEGGSQPDCTPRTPADDGNCGELSAACLEARRQQSQRGADGRHGMQSMDWTQWWKLFTPQAADALTTFSDLLGEVSGRARWDASTTAGLDVDGVRLHEGGAGADAYADAVVTYLAFAIDKCADYW